MSPSREVGLVVSGVKGDLDKVAEQARMVERAGYHGVYSTESGIGSLALCLHMAMATERVRVGSAITNFYLRHPAICAQETSYINEISGGRMDLGLGTAHQPTNEPRGIDMSKPLTALRNYVAAMQAETWGEPSLYIGALRQKMTATAGEISDGAILNMIPKSLLPKWVEALQAGASRRTDGKTRAKTCLFLGCAMSENVEEARDVARAGMAFYQRLPFYQALMDEAGYGAEAKACGAALARGDQQAALAAISDEMVDDLYLAGTPAQIKASMDEYFDQGAELLILSTRAASDRIPDAFENTCAALAPGG